MDPIIKYLSEVEFNPQLFDMLHRAGTDPELYDKLFITPELFVLMLGIDQLSMHDPNKDTDPPIDHKAFVNFLRWITIRFATDPVWQSYIGWFLRYTSKFAQTDSYYPIVYSPRWTMKNFMTRNEKINIAEENAKVKSPEEIFKRKKTK